MYREISDKLLGGNYAISQGDGRILYLGKTPHTESQSRYIGKSVITVSLVEYHREIAITSQEYSIELNDSYSGTENLLQHAHELVQQLGCKVIIR